MESLVFKQLPCWGEKLFESVEYCTVVNIAKILKSESSTTPFPKEFSCSAFPEFRFSLFYGRTTLSLIKSNNSHYLLFLFGGLHWISSKWEWLISVRVKVIILCPMLLKMQFKTFFLIIGLANMVYESIYNNLQTCLSVCVGLNLKAS